MTQDKIDRLSLFRVPKFFETFNAAKTEVSDSEEWSDELGMRELGMRRPILLGWYGNTRPKLLLHYSTHASTNSVQ